jgi:hypothetical protein
MEVLAELVTPDSVPVPAKVRARKYYTYLAIPLLFSLIIIWLINFNNLF